MIQAELAYVYNLKSTYRPEANRTVITPHYLLCEKTHHALVITSSYIVLPAVCWPNTIHTQRTSGGVGSMRIALDWPIYYVQLGCAQHVYLWPVRVSSAHFHPTRVLIGYSV